MNPQQLMARGALYFENVQEGLKNYPNRTIKLEQESARQRLFDLWKGNGFSDSFVDFYYFSLPDDSKQQAASQLNQEEAGYLDKLTVQEGQIIFPLDEMLLTIAVKLNASAMLFSTFYFTNPKSTWWGNYNQEYIVFGESERSLEWE